MREFGKDAQLPGYDSDRPLRATLHEIGLQSPRIADLADFYRDALGYAFAEDAQGALGIGADRRLRLCPGPAKTLAYAAYAVPTQDDLRALERRLDNAGVPFKHEASPGMQSSLRFADPDGNTFVFGLADAAELMPSTETGNRPARLQHVVFASRHLDRLLQFFTEVVGFVLSDRVVDNEGVLKTAFLRCSHEHHSLAVFSASEDRLDHHCYEAADWNLIRDWADSFGKRRIPLKWGPGRHGPGDNLFLFIHDPDGNWVEISAELETVEHDRPVGDWPHEEHTLNSWGQGLLRS